MSEEVFEDPQTIKTAGWPRIILLAVLGFGLLAVAAYTGYWCAIQQVQFAEEPTAVPQPTQTPVIKQTLSPLFRPIDNSLIVFEGGEGGTIFLMDGLNGQPMEIVEGHKPNFSPDRSKIAYVDGDNNICIYNVRTTGIETLNTSELRLTAVSWSPNGRYLVTDSGSAPTGAGGIYEYPTGRKIVSFSVYSERTSWVSSEELVFVEPQKVSPYRPWGSGKGRGLSRITLPDGNKQMLVQAATLEDFDLIKVENGIVYFSKETVKSSDDWSFSDRQKISYWQMSSDGEGKTEIVEPETLKKNVLSMLPTRFSEYHVFSRPIPHPSVNSWVIFSIHKEGSVFDDPICIMDLNNPSDSFLQVGVGAHPSW